MIGSRRQMGLKENKQGGGRFSPREVGTVFNGVLRITAGFQKVNIK